MELHSQVKSPLYVALCPDPPAREERRQRDGKTRLAREERETERERESEKRDEQRDEREMRERERETVRV